MRASGHLPPGRAPVDRPIRAAGCAPATGKSELDLNNVRALIETGGSMWQIRASDKPAYEVPKTSDRSGAHAIFAGSLWMGGRAPDNQLKLAAVTYRAQGNDFWPGPLSTDGSAAVDQDVCSAYDDLWKTHRQDVQRHEAYERCKRDPLCNEAVEFPNYTVPQVFFEWPALGDLSRGQSQFLAPFIDYDEDDVYDPTMGDAPGYNLTTDGECQNRNRNAIVPLYGDENIWWIFNDKGNTHTETDADAIGMEVRAQAFAFATNDEVNNMTFYNYLLINQGTQTLTNAFFGQWVDADVGCANDDYVGCDVQRGLAYAYNGDANDADCNSTPGYGDQTPAVGIDFFEGPYQDVDHMDNPLATTYAEAVAGNGIPYKGLGIGYGDGIVDNERYGMRAFIYYNGGADNGQGDPIEGVGYYNYMQAKWLDGSSMFYGGSGHYSDPDADQNTPTNYMFPGDSDPVGWATGGVVQPPWTEESAGNFPDDRRLFQSAGPFTLEPGAFNNITVGVVWSRASSGGPFASVQLLRQADDKAQALFDNCFQLLDGPDAPQLTMQELDRELIMYLRNPSGNNVGEGYQQVDPIIPESYVGPDSLPVLTDREYRFQGYQVFQVKDATVSVDQLKDISLARLVSQSDRRDGNAQLVNYINNDQIGLPVPVEMVNGADEGIAHSFRITEDKFAQGDTRLINFKTYYFIAVAYAHNNWLAYDPVQHTGQPFRYLASRKDFNGGGIKSVAAIPHKPAPEEFGTVQQAQYGDEPPITRIEGQGHGNRPIMIDEATENAIVNSPDARVDEVTYRSGMGPVQVKVIDPLQLPAAQFELRFTEMTDEVVPQARWILTNLNTGESIPSDRSIAVAEDQLIPQWGLSVSIEQSTFDTVYFESNGFAGDEREINIKALQGELTFENPDLDWLTGIADTDGDDVLNWIRGGSEWGVPPDDIGTYADRPGFDMDEAYEQLLGGMWAPFELCGDHPFQPGSYEVTGILNTSFDLRDLPDVLVVFTPDKDKWSRAPVFEMQADSMLAGGLEKLWLRAGNSVDKNGVPDGSGTGMGWFPGYAIDMGTGERLNIGFGEDSFLNGDNGNDMQWNPTATFATNLGAPRFGGQHWIYVFRNERRFDANPDRVPHYDGGAFIQQMMQGGSFTGRRKVWDAIAWVGSAMLNEGHTLLECEARVRLNVARVYEPYVQPYAGYEPAIEPQLNNGVNLYRFSTTDLATLTQQQTTAESALDLIGIVPNPYYAFSGYETSRLDNRVKFINLPQACTISIFNASGTLVRKYGKDNDLTYLDWDLRNMNNVPIAGGTYICHIEAPVLGERVLKWFGVIRPVDLQNF